MIKQAACKRLQGLFQDFAQELTANFKEGRMQIKGGKGNPILSIWKANFQGGGEEQSIPSGSKESME